MTTKTTGAATTGWCISDKLKSVIVINGTYIYRLDPPFQSLAFIIVFLSSLLEHTVVVLVWRLKGSVELRGAFGYTTLCLKPFA